MPDYDVMILGGGCAGLSLAMQLAVLGSACPRTLIVEQRRIYDNDRTWCFWGDENTPLQHLVQHRWHTMALQEGSKRVTVDCGVTPYQMIAADKFYAEALRSIDQCDQIVLILGAVIDGPPEQRNDLWEITSGGAHHRAKVVIDTRPGPPPAVGGATLWQSFYGQEIDCEAACFDGDCVELMDFSATDAARIIFTYVLPLSATRALIEVTVFGPTPLSVAALTNDLDHALQKRTGNVDFRILRKEHGILPMGMVPAERLADPHYVYAGLMQGAARPATGYAFQRIQRWAALCAQRLAEGKPPVGHAADPPLLRAMDHLFLSVLQAQPLAAPALFLSLFGQVEPTRLIRFLSDRGTLGDYAAIIRALPASPFLRQLPGTLLAAAGAVIR